MHGHSWRVCVHPKLAPQETAAAGDVAFGHRDGAGFRGVLVALELIADARVFLFALLHGVRELLILLAQADDFLSDLATDHDAGGRRGSCRSRR